MQSRGRLVLAVSNLAHVLHDGFSDILYVLFPVWAAQFHLSYAQVGLIKTLYTGGMSLSQIPAGLLAERRGERGLLVLGTAVTAWGFLTAALWVEGFASLALTLLVAGVGSGVQHPLASSLVSKTYETGPRRAALGAYNFSGDLGKIGATAAVGLAVAAVGWRLAAGGYGTLGLLGAATIWAALARLGVGGPQPTGAAGTPGDGWGIRDSRGFLALAAMGLIDNGTRSAFLVFLPFALIAKGSSPAGVGLALAVLFVGGAVGKLVCGLLAERLGVIRMVVLTETATALGIVAIVAAPLGLALGLLIPMGIALNGTSSVLYGTVADLVIPARRSRAYGLYYTVSLGASGVAPLVYGMVGDALGVPGTLAVIAAVVLTTLPLTLALRPAVERGRAQMPAVGG
ncbi:MAG: MFS transporter [Armatimonadota bacterium]|nr:MFS transporter [Armatimonadota bacterium]MDR7520243.1 MFS transporter [Armatimonadota bacterium]MDR7549421.1 MFS transporter [Armatimonadota bacterium]